MKPQPFLVFLMVALLTTATVRDGAELALWVWKHLDQEEPGHTKLSLGMGPTALLAKHRVPIAISSNSQKQPAARIFDQWSTDPGETFVSIPLLARRKLVGLINLQRHRARRYSIREVKLLSSVGVLLGADIGISRVESQNSDLLMELETRKLVERGKGILQRNHGLSEEQAYLTLQRYSRQKRKPMREIAQAIILGDECKRGALNDPTPVLRRPSPGNTTMLEIAEINCRADATE